MCQDMRHKCVEFLKYLRLEIAHKKYTFKASTKAVAREF